MLWQILGWLVVIGCGGCLMYFANSIADIFWPSARAQKYFWGTRNATLSIGFIIMIIGFLVLFGIFKPSTSEVWSLEY